MVSINTELTPNENVSPDTSDDNVQQNHPRLKYSAEQVEFLKSQFAINEYPTYTQRKALANSIGISEYKVKNWFRNRRKEANPNDCSYVRTRANINDEQLGILYEAYSINPRMNDEQRQMIAKITSLPPKTVKYWFQNHRFRINNRKTATYKIQRTERRGRRRKRVSFTKSQTKYLEEYFLENPKPNRAEMQQIAREVGDKIKRIGTWFMNRRLKAKAMPNLDVSAGTLYGPLPKMVKSDEEEVIVIDCDVANFAEDDDNKEKSLTEPLKEMN